MDKRVTFRFYEVGAGRRVRHSFSEALRLISDIARPSGRERQLAQDFYMRAEQIVLRNGVIVGDLTRIQKTNFPSEISGDLRNPLSTRNYLGHSVVFRYVPGTSTLGIQYDPRVISPSRFCEYVTQMLETGPYTLTPIVRDDMWDQFQRSAVRKISIAVAQPNNLARLEGGAASATQAIRQMAEAYEAPSIVVEMSMGHRRGSLSEQAKDLVRRLRGEMVADRANITSLSAKVKNEDGETETIDLLSDILSVKQTLELTDRDHEANFRIKFEALRVSMNEWL
jgi:hypothetical protein